MATGQAVLAMEGRDSVHLQFNFKPGFDKGAFQKAASELWGFSVTGIANWTLASDHEGVAGIGNIIVGFRPELWRDKFSGAIPANLKSFSKPMVGVDGRTVPATQCDLWIWIMHSGADVLSDSIYAVKKLLAPFVDLVSEQVCFRYHNHITFDGFADGVANPNVFNASKLVYIGEGDKAAGGSTALVQKWIMRIDELRGLSPEEGETVYGRTKLGSHELDPRVENTHVERNKIIRNGEEIDIVRHNANFYCNGESGIIFTGLSNDISVTTDMLRQMYGIGPDGKKITDRLIDFSEPVSSSIFFIPSMEALAAADMEAEDAD